jgi:hypothetical protein
MKAILEPRMVTARIHGSALFTHGAVAVPDWIAVSSQGAFIKQFGEKTTASLW